MMLDQKCMAALKLASLLIIYIKKQMRENVTKFTVMNYCTPY